MTCTHHIARSALVPFVFAIVLQLPARTPVFTQTPTQPEKATRSLIAASYGNLPLSFEANQGQTDNDRVKFLARGSDYVLHLTPTAAVLTLAQPREAANSSAPAVVRMTLVGASANPEIIGREALPGKSHYYMGSDPTKWRTNIPNYAKVAYQEVYPGVDLVYYGNQRQLEYDFIVSPGADPTVIRLAFDGVDRLDVDDQGDLVLRVGRGEIRQHKPVIYQDIDGVRREISGRYLIRDHQQVAFHVGDYDTSRPLTIDPVLVYAIDVGDSVLGDRGLDIAVDADGRAYVTGRVCCSDEVFVARVNLDGTVLDYFTLLMGYRPACHDGGSQRHLQRHRPGRTLHERP